MDAIVICWNCHKPVSGQQVLIGFRAACPHCSSDLHVCKNCRYHAPAKPNECIVPGTEPIKDREAANFCEEFKLALPKEAPKPPPKTILGEVEKPKDFRSLFKDDPEN